MQIPAEVLKILVCPESRLPLAQADAQFIQSLNTKISQGAVTNRSGARVSDTVDGALVRSDHKVCYPIRNDIPSLLIEDGIILES